MSKKDKAYQAAAEHMAHRYGYNATLEPNRLDDWILDQVTLQRDTWDIIWKAARRAEWRHSQDDQEALQAQITNLMLSLERTEGNLEQVIQTSKNRGDRIRDVEAMNTSLLAENQRLKNKLDAAKRGERLYEQVEKENRYHENALNLAETELTQLRAQLARERTQHQVALDACTKKRNELLVRAVEAEAKLDSQPKVPTRPEGEGWNLSWVRMTGETITGTVTPERPPLAPCTGAMGRHKCDMQTRRGFQHPDRHHCHCGIWWTHGGETGGVG